MTIPFSDLQRPDSLTHITPEQYKHLLLTLHKVQDYTKDRIEEMRRLYWGTSADSFPTELLPSVLVYDILKDSDFNRLSRAFEIIMSKKYQLIIDPPSPSFASWIELEADIEESIEQGKPITKHKAIRSPFPVEIRIMRSDGSKVPIVYKVTFSDPRKKRMSAVGEIEHYDYDRQHGDYPVDCTCPDFVNRNRVKCKHILASLIVIGQLQNRKNEEDEDIKKQEEWRREQEQEQGNQNYGTRNTPSD